MAVWRVGPRGVSLGEKPGSAVSVIQGASARQKTWLVAANRAAVLARRAAL